MSKLPELHIDSDIARAWSIPAPYYTDPELPARENERIFARTWQVVGHRGQLANPGDFFTTELLGEPLLLVRGSRGELRGFFNVCRHRAGPPAEGCGSRKVFRCGYHGWTYGLDGSLISAPEFEGQQGFDPTAFALAPVRAEEWSNLIFVNLDPDAQPLVKALGQLPAQAERFAFAGMKLFARRTYDMKCNWKTYVDNYLEGYHLPSVHPGLNRELDYNAYTVEPYARHVRQFSPIRGAQPGDATPRRYPEASADLTTDYFWIFPNWMLNCYPDNVSLNIVLPVAAEPLAGDFRVVSAGEGSRRCRCQSIGGIQRSDPDGRCGHLRDRAEKSALAKLPAWALQHQAGDGSTCISSNVCGCDEFVAPVSR